MEPRAELDIVAPAAKVAEERLPDRDAIALVAVFHGALEKWLPAVILWSLPNR